MDRDRFAAIHCSIARACAVVADPWALLVLRDVFLGITRYEELRRDLGIATNVLAERLDRLVTEDVLVRRQYADRPPRYEYLLTEAGRDLYGVVLTLLTWGDRHRSAAGPPVRLVHTDCGERTTPTVTCDRCGGPLTAETVVALAGPGGRLAPGTTVVAELLTAREPT